MASSSSSSSSSPDVQQNAEEEMQSCPICTELINQSADGEGNDEEIAKCGACFQPLHAYCLRAAVLADSRCPLCRQDLSVVGYTISGVDQARPEYRRFEGEDAQLIAMIREVLTQTSNTIRRMQQLCRRINVTSRTMSVKTLTNVKNEAAGLRAQVQALYEQTNSLPTEVVGDIQRYVGRSLQRAIKVIASYEKTCQGMIRQRQAYARTQERIKKLKGKIRHVRREIKSSRQARAKAKAKARSKEKAVLKRPAAAKAKVKPSRQIAPPVLKRPAAASSSSGRTRRKP
eukprot:TRINITY_DN32633_c0_g1_i1.p1 TRINITY_DN32633_c0_g1~~TRINITY_DN32633_c0_g1_i1.p1  ORF type:complete len:295 (+),score=42.86 TRINITY_DN32633_c0_g1_i1:27-887(+)